MEYRIIIYTDEGLLEERIEEFKKYKTGTNNIQESRFYIQKINSMMKDTAQQFINKLTKKDLYNVMELPILTKQLDFYTRIFKELSLSEQNIYIKKTITRDQINYHIFKSENFLNKKHKEMINELEDISDEDIERITA